MSIKVKALWVVLVFCMAGDSLLAQEKKGEAQGSAASSSQAPAASSPHSFAISPEDAAKKNPIKFTDASVNRGKKVFITQCALCHGEKGDGKGDLAKEMTLTLPDFTQPDSLAKRTDGELFTIVGTGKDPMPSQKGRMTDPQLWNLVNYLRALGGKVPAKATAKEAADENVVLIPQ
jgi:mono/diheme cytochrome c family protein